MGLTNRSRLYHVADGETLDGFVLGCTSRTVGASNRFDMATSLLVASTVYISQTSIQVDLGSNNAYFDARFFTMLAKP